MSLCSSGAAELQGLWPLSRSLPDVASITAGHFDSFREKAATGTTTGRANSPNRQVQNRSCTSCTDAAQEGDAGEGSEL